MPINNQLVIVYHVAQFTSNSQDIKSPDIAANFAVYLVIELDIQFLSMI